MSDEKRGPGRPRKAPVDELKEISVAAEEKGLSVRRVIEITDEGTIARLEISKTYWTITPTGRKKLVTRRAK